jgi:hypothetical protein
LPYSRPFCSGCVRELPSAIARQKRSERDLRGPSR